MKRKQKASKVEVRVAVLAAQALELRIAGNSYRAIGKKLGLTHVRVWQLVTAELDEIKTTSRDEAERLKKLDLERLDRMTVKLFRNRGNPRAADSLLKIMERRARLLGLDAPSKVEGSGPNGAPLLPPVINIGFQNGGPGRPDPGPQGS